MNKNNPFKFGTIVEGEYFTDRIEEQRQVKEILTSSNHLILISPRRYGKTSLVQKVVKESGRPAFQLNLQLVTDVEDFASHLLKQVFKHYPMQRIKHMLSHFRIVPTLSVNPMTEGMELTFQPFTDAYIVLEDVLALIEKLGEKDVPPIVVLDEFQEIVSLDKHLDKKLRAILQLHSHVNYVFLGSQESMMQEIFERKKSPFYHFGYFLHEVFLRAPGGDGRRAKADTRGLEGRTAVERHHVLIHRDVGGHQGHTGGLQSDGCYCHGG